MRKPLVTIVDNALDRKNFRALYRRIIGLQRERLRNSYQTTFWFDFNESPACIVESAALKLRDVLPPSVGHHVIGVEWWLSRMRTSNVMVDFHRDHDIAWAQKTGVQRYPRMSSLLYLNRCRGGLLAVTKEPPNPQNPAMAPDHLDFDLVTPAPNRFTFFRGSLTHGVLDAENCIPGKKLPTERRFRLAIAINFWARRPTKVPRFSESRHYRSLRLK